MSNEVEVYGLCSSNCKYRVLTVDQTADLIQQMAENGWQVPDGYIPATAVNTIVEKNAGRQMSVFVGTQAEYDAYTGDKTNLLKFISDDNTIQQIFDRLNALGVAIDNINDKPMVNVIQDTNGVMKLVDVIIPQKKVLWEGSQSNATSTNHSSGLTYINDMDIELNDTISGGDVLEITAQMPYEFEICRLKIRAGEGSIGYLQSATVGVSNFTMGTVNVSDRSWVNGTPIIRFSPLRRALYSGNSTTFEERAFTVTKIVKVIE